MADDRFKAAGAVLDATMLNAMLQMPAARIMAQTNHPVSRQAKQRIETALKDALGRAIEPGTVVRVAVDTPGELLYVSELLTELFKQISDPSLVEEKSSRTQFELSNNSALLLNLKNSEDRS